MSFGQFLVLVFCSVLASACFRLLLLVWLFELFYNVGMISDLALTGWGSQVSLPQLGEGTQVMGPARRAACLQDTRKKP